jgi:hypothetical protein
VREGGRNDPNIVCTYELKKINIGDLICGRSHQPITMEI